MKFYLRKIFKPIHLAIGSSFIGVLVNSSSASSVYIKNRITDIRLSSSLELGAVIGAIGGAVVGGVVGAVTEEALTRAGAVEFIIKQENGQSIAVVQTNEDNLVVGDKILILRSKKIRIIKDNTVGD